MMLFTEAAGAETSQPSASSSTARASTTPGGAQGRLSTVRSDDYVDDMAFWRAPTAKMSRVTFSRGAVETARGDDSDLTPLSNTAYNNDSDHNNDDDVDNNTSDEATSNSNSDSDASASSKSFASTCSRTRRGKNARRGRRSGTSIRRQREAERAMRAALAEQDEEERAATAALPHQELQPEDVELNEFFDTFAADATVDDRAA